MTVSVIANTVQPFQKVTNGRVLGSIAHQDDRVLFSKRFDESGCPPLRKVGPPKIATADNVIGLLLRARRRQTSVEIDESVENVLRVKVWHYRGNVDSQAPFSALEEKVKVSRDKARLTLRRTRKRQEIFVVGKVAVPRFA